LPAGRIGDAYGHRYNLRRRGRLAMKIFSCSGANPAYCLANGCRQRTRDEALAPDVCTLRYRVDNLRPERRFVMTTKKTGTEKRNSSKDGAKAAGQVNPGAALNAARKRQSLTLVELSERCGLPVSTLSKLENGKMALTFDKLTRISEALGVDIAELFASASSGADPARFNGRRSITRAGEGYAIESSTYGHRYPAADLLNKRFVPIVAELHARTLEEFGPLVRHAGEEYTFVLEGTVDLHTDLYAPTRLQAGDSIYFDSGMAHAYLAVGDAPARVLSICSASEVHLRESIIAGTTRVPATPRAATAAGRKTK
jgi:transcriptional regulator with XRE-family HTH domain